MTNNERIAEWAGWRRPSGEFDFIPDHTLYWESDNSRYYVLNDSWPERRILSEEFEEFYYWHTDDGRGSTDCPKLDEDITMWHGKDGLLDEIEKRDMWDKVLRVLTKQLVVSYIPRGMWDILRSTPTQLSAALVKVIEEEQL